MQKRRTRKYIRRSDNCWLVATTITFNIKDPHQLTLLEFIETMPNYSGTMKRLIAEHMAGQDRPQAPAPEPERWTQPEDAGSFDEEWAVEEFL